MYVPVCPKCGYHLEECDSDLIFDDYFEELICENEDCGLKLTMTLGEV